jgi:hypothetical protein
VPARRRLWDAARDIGLEAPQTLLTYAAWLGRAWIVRAMLRAGADPAVRGSEVGLYTSVCCFTTS